MRFKGIIILCFCLGFRLCVNAQVSYASKIAASSGFTNNLYMAPSVYTGNDTAGIADFRIDDYYTRFSFSNDVKFSFKKNRYLMVSPWIRSTNYFNQRNANNMLYKLVLDYKTPIKKKFDVNFGFTLEKNKKLTIDILTDDGVNVYDYFLYAPNVNLTYKINPNFKIELSNAIGDKTYVPMPSGQDFSHWCRGTARHGTHKSISRSVRKG